MKTRTQTIMTNTDNEPLQPIHRASLGKRMLQGAAVALFFISFFLLSVEQPDPSWQKVSMVKPLLVVPVAGALGGVFYYFMDHLRWQGGWRNILAIILSLLGYIISLWLGTVLGLHGTIGEE